MTIIQPSRHKNTIKFLLLFFGIIIVGGSLAIFEYNSIVDLRYELKVLKKSIVDLEASNADLRGEFYASTGGDKLESLAFELGLTMDKTPDYMSSNQWLSDSSY